MTITDTVIRGPVKKDRPAPVTRTVTRRNVAGHDLGSVDLEPSIFGLEPNLAVLHQVVTAQLAAARSGTQSTKTRVRGPRRRGQAVRPEGHRPGPPGLEPLALHERWRRRPRPQAAQLPPAHPQEDGAPGPSVGAERPGGRPTGSPWSTSGAGRRRRPRTPSRRCATLKITGTVLVVLADDETVAGRSFANLPNVQTTSFGQLSAHDVLRSDWILFSDRTLPGSAGSA